MQCHQYNMEGAGDNNLPAQQLIPVGQLPGSAQDSGVEEGCDDPDSNESSSTVSRGGAGIGFLRHNSSDREGVTAGEESNLSYGDPPSHPQILGRIKVLFNFWPAAIQLLV